ncbi:MAG: FliM/FliN family flagellar motor switch protein [Phycisphaerae bacterium]|jgi:flagellar motor switch protein FliM
MTPAPDENLTALLLRSISGSPAAAAEGGQDYDWGAPHIFQSEQMDKLRALAAQAAKRLTTAMEALQVPMTIKPLPVTLVYSQKLSAAAPAFYVTLTDEAGQPAGMMEVGAETALGWVGSLLGSPGASGAADRALSDLESSLLMDVVATVVKEFAIALRPGKAEMLRHSRELLTALPSLGSGAEEYCRFSFAGDARSDTPAVSFVLACRLLNNLVGASEGKKRTPEEVRKDMLAVATLADVGGSVCIGSAVASMREIMGLTAGDVLVLDKAAGEPVDLMVKDKIVANGDMVACDGQKGIRIRVRHT